MAISKKTPSHGGALAVQVLWACVVHHATPEPAAQGLVTDLLQQLVQGRPVTVHVAAEDGSERMIEASAGNAHNAAAENDNRGLAQGDTFMRPVIVLLLTAVSLFHPLVF